MTTTNDSIEIPAETFDVSRHNGTVTISNPATGGHRTFQIRTIRRGNLLGRRVASLLIGSNNDDDDSYLGFAFVSDSGHVNVWSKHRETEFETFAKMLANPGAYLARGLMYQIAGTCRRCNRTLTVPASITDGYGPECRRKVAAGI